MGGAGPTGVFLGGAVHVSSIPECVTSAFTSSIGSGAGMIRKAAGLEFADSLFVEARARTV